MNYVGDQSCLGEKDTTTFVIAVLFNIGLEQG